MKQTTDTSSGGASGAPVELSMEEILASIRRIVTDDPEQSDIVPSRHGSRGEGVSRSFDEVLELVDPLEDEVLELTQLVQDDGAVIDMERHRSAQVLQAFKTVRSEDNRFTQGNPAQRPVDKTIETTESALMRAYKNLSESGEVPASQNSFQEKGQKPSAPLSSVPKDFKTLKSLREVEGASKISSPPPTAASQGVPQSSPISVSKDGPSLDGEPSTLARASGESIVSHQIANAIAKNFSRLVEANTQATQVPLNSITLEQLTKELIQPYLYQWLDSHFETLLTKLLKKWIETNLPDVVERLVTEEIRKITLTHEGM